MSSMIAARTDMDTQPKLRSFYVCFPSTQIEQSFEQLGFERLHDRGYVTRITSVETNGEFRGEIRPMQK